MTSTCCWKSLLTLSHNTWSKSQFFLEFVLVRSLFIQFSLILCVLLLLVCVSVMWYFILILVMHIFKANLEKIISFDFLKSFCILFYKLLEWNLKIWKLTFLTIVGLSCSILLIFVCMIYIYIYITIVLLYLKIK